MNPKPQLSSLFFKELKQYNTTNFRTLHKADLSVENASVTKAFSSVITRYFIFCEKHPEIDDMQKRILYFQLKIDMIARYFANYPNPNLDEFKAFQIELRNYVKESRDEVDADGISTSAAIAV